MLIHSKIHDYEVMFEDILKSIYDFDKPVYIIDEKLFTLYDFKQLKNVFYLNASEENKSLENISDIIKLLLETYSIKKDITLVAIGGGVIQDIVSFIASILFRGIDWVFYPTTLLAQVDSCIGSKTSINLGEMKNQVGTFYPPRKVVIDINFLDTLSKREILSGMGEVLKVHLLGGKDIPSGNFKAKIKSSLVLKQMYIESDEYDKGIRNLLNYGHSFGHAIESATKFNIAHGEAIIVGMDIANFISFKLGYLTAIEHDYLSEKIFPFISHVPLDNISVEDIIKNIKHDKKNIDNQIFLILTKGYGKMFKTSLSLKAIYNYTEEYFNKKNAI